MNGTPSRYTRYGVMSLVFACFSLLNLHAGPVSDGGSASYVEIQAADTYVLSDASNDMSVEAVAGIDLTQWERPPERFHTGPRTGVLWIRFDITNESGNPVVVVGEHNGVSRFDVWVSRGKDEPVEYVGFSCWRSGPGRRSVISPQAIAAVPLHIPPPDAATVFIRIPGDGGTPPRLYAGAPASFFVRNAERMLLQGTGIGFTTMMVVFSLMLVLSLRRIDIAVYSLLTILSVVLVNYANGFGPMVLWADFPTLTRVIAKTVVLFYTLVAAEFFRRFLKPGPRQTGVLTGILILEIVLLLYITFVLFTPLDTDIRATAIVSPVAFLILLVILFAGVRLRVENARALLASGSGTILVGIVSYLNNLGLLPESVEIDQALLVTVAIQIQSAVIAAAIVGSAEFRLTRERFYRQRAETQVEELREQAIETERMSNIATLVGSVSHELGTPLGIGVTLGSDLVTRTRHLSDQFRNETMTRTVFQEYLASVAESGEMIEEHMTRARELIDGFKAIAADQAVLSPREINLAEYLPRLIRSLQPRFKHTKHNLQLLVDDDPVVFTVPGYLSQVIINLVNNALRHAFSDDMHGTVIVSATALPPDNEGHRRVEIRVSDNGQGITDEVRSRVFEPYFTTAADSDGTGLGLSIVKNLTENDLNGAIELLPAGHVGTEFRLEIRDIATSAPLTRLQGDYQ
ncbi:MAG: ATP-binding protein [Alkalispirochaeta sp.]